MAAERKKEEPTFYRAWHRPDKLESGIRIELERSVEFNSYRVDCSNLAELVKLPLTELQAKRKDGAAAEKTIFEKVQAAAQEWETQAAQTMLLDRALEYIHTLEVKHTSNEWKQQKDGAWEISNRVYNMRYKISQELDGKRNGQWLVTWGIALNRPSRPATEKYYYSGDIMVVELKKKYYNAEAEAQHYIQGRFDVYVHLFTELSPPIPDKYKRHFCINGVLLPGYTVAPPERAPQEVADELLTLLNDSDIALPPTAEREPAKAPEEPTPKPTPEKSAAPKSPNPSRPSAKKKQASKKQTTQVR